MADGRSQARNQHVFPERCFFGEGLFTLLLRQHPNSVIVVPMLSILMLLMMMGVHATIYWSTSTAHICEGSEGAYMRTHAHLPSRLSVLLQKELGKGRRTSEAEERADKRWPRPAS